MTSLVLSLLLVSPMASGSRIIGVFPTPSVSHQVVYRPLMEGLALRGHDVLVLTTDPMNRVTGHLSEIDMSNVSYPVWRSRFNFADMHERDPDTSSFSGDMFDVLFEISARQLAMPEVARLIADRRRRFDLCIVEAFVPTNYAFKERFGCSMILITSLTGDLNNLEAIGGRVNPAAYPRIFYRPMDVASFWHRLGAVYSEAILRYDYTYKIYPPFEALANRVFANNVTLYEAQKEADLMFVASNPLIEGAKPYSPRVIIASGVHIRPPLPLPEKLKRPLDASSPLGAIYFSLGSNVKAAHLRSDRRRAFLDAFGELPFTVLWKWEGDAASSEGWPKNVHVAEWMPQQDVLAHMNVKLFITQGGHQSIEEGIHYNVPMIGIPFFSDQYFNVDRIEKLSIGRRLDLETLTKEAIKEAILDVVNDPKYRREIKRLSVLMNDRPMSSLDTWIWWSEYVLRHRSTEHMVSPGGYLPWYQYYMVDIFAFVACCLIIALYCIVVLLKRINAVFNNLLRSVFKAKKM